MTVWPMRAGTYTLTSGFGPRWGSHHAGLDFGADDGTPIYAAADGVVDYIGPADGFGQWIVLRHDSGESTVYGHMWDAYATGLKGGDRVRAGDRIASVGANGEATGPHLHFEVHPGKWVRGSQIDPEVWLGGAVRPDFNEYAMWSNNSQGRAGIKPDLWLIHTQEGPGNADSLARYLCSDSGVSYHYTISEDPNDHGVTVVDVVDTDLASWSVLDYNNRSINLCFAGSSASWSRDQWMRQSRAIDVAAYLAVEDCKKYNFSSVVVPPPYRGTPGISDHAYVTHMGIGTHTDVGANFPWDYFASRVDLYAGRVKPPAPTPPPVQPPTPVPPADSLTARVDRLERAVADLQAKCR